MPKNAKTLGIATAALLAAALVLGQIVSALAYGAEKTGAAKPPQKTSASATAQKVPSITELRGILLNGLKDLSRPKWVLTGAKPLPRVKSTEHLKTLLAWDENTSYGYDTRLYLFDSGAGAAESTGSAPAAAPGPAMEAPSAAANDSIEYGSSGGSDGTFSQTNVQVAGVDEGDIVKTDGKYIYSLSGSRVFIFKADGGKTVRQSVIDLKIYGQELYLSGDRLAVTGTRSDNDGSYYEESGILPAAGKIVNGLMAPGYRPSKEYSVFSVYDITDRANPKLQQTFELEGYLAATRVIGQTLYFVANKSVYYHTGGGEITPYYKDSKAGSSARALPAEKIAYFPDGNSYSGFMMAGAMALGEVKEVAFETFLNDGAVFYMNQDNLYVARTDWAWGEKTDLYRFKVEPGAVIYAAEGSVRGRAINQYSMDEHNGYFRIATTDGDGNRISVLDAALNEVGCTPDLAKGESIQSTRFMGDMAYMVTYLQTDPLYSVDLSNPKAPKVLGELKIPGFSTYLHPIGGDRLVGFGRHTAEVFYRDGSGKEIPTGSTRDLGQKISLFDVSDPQNLKESDIMLLGQDTYSEAFTNPKALMADPQKHLFGFFMSDYGKAYSSKYNGVIRLVAVEGSKLKDVASIDYNMVWQDRLLYIGNILYAVSGETVTAYDMADFAPITG